MLIMNAEEFNDLILAIKTNQKKRLDLSQHEWNQEQINTILIALKVNTSITLLNIKNVPLTTAENINLLSFIIRNNTSITSLTLGMNFAVDYLLTPLVKNIAESIKRNNTLLNFHLYYSNQDFDDIQEEYKFITFLLKGLKYNHSIKHFLLNYYIEPQHDLFPVLYKPMQEISMYKTPNFDNVANVDSALPTVIAGVIKHNSTIEYLDLRGNFFCDMQKIALSLMKNVTLKNLNLRGNAIDCAGASFLAKMLSVNNTLQNLNLQYNSIKSEGAALLLFALRGLSPDEGSQETIERNAALKSLQLDANQIENKEISIDIHGDQKFKQPLLTSSVVFLKDNANLQCLTLSLNPMWQENKRNQLALTGMYQKQLHAITVRNRYQTERKGLCLYYLCMQKSKSKIRGSIINIITM